MFVDESAKQQLAGIIREVLSHDGDIEEKVSALLRRLRSGRDDIWIAWRPRPGELAHIALESHGEYSVAPAARAALNATQDMDQQAERLLQALARDENTEIATSLLNMHIGIDGRRFGELSLQEVGRLADEHERLELQDLSDARALRRLQPRIGRRALGRRKASRGAARNLAAER